MKRRNWLRTTIAMLTLIATVLETGFTPVSTLAAEFTNEDGIVVNNDAIEEAEQSSNDGELQMEVTRDSEEPAAEEAAPEEQPEENADLAESSQESNVVEGDTLEEAQDGETSEEAADGEVIDGEATEGNVVDGEELVEETGNTEAAEEEVFEEAEELKKEGTLSVTDSGISGSGYDEISIYVNTDDLANKDKFRVEFTGPASASYNPVLNDELDKTNGGRYDFEGLEGGDFTVRATSSDDVILSYRYNEDGYPEIVVESKPVEKILETKTLTSVDDAEIQAITGEGFESVTVNFNTEELSEKAAFKLIVESDADATVDGYDAKSGITGLDKNTGSLTIEGLEEESFTAYVISDNDEVQIKTIVDIDSVEDGEATFTVDNVDTKREYGYEDDKVKVTATLEKADAVPDDAYFGVQLLSEQETEDYLDVLNRDKGEDEVPATIDNTLLYDIGFYTDDSKSEEIEPEEGSVKVSIEFKKEQLSEEIGAMEPEEVTVTHIIEDGADVTTEKVEADTSVDDQTIEFTTENFSKYAIEVDGKLFFEPGTKKDFKDALGANVNYGQVANSIVISGDMETNLATSLLKLDGNAKSIKSSRNNGGGTGYTFVADAEGGTGFYMMNNSNQGNNVIYVGKDSNAVAHFDMQEMYNKGTRVDKTSFSKQDITDKVEALIETAKTNSGDIATESGAYKFADFSSKAGGYGSYTIDISNNPSADPEGNGTYYFNLTKAEYDAIGGDVSNFVFVKKPDQNVVLTITGSPITLRRNIGFKMAGSNEIIGADGTKVAMNEHLIINLPDATSVNFSGSVDAAVLCPNADLKIDSVSSGWVVAKDISKNGSVEFHNTWHDMPITETEEKDYEFKVTKAFNAPEGVNWPSDGFTFTLEPYSSSNDHGNTWNPDPPMPGDQEKVEITIHQGSDPASNTGSFGKISFDALTIYNEGKELGQVSDHFAGVTGVVDKYYMVYMYTIKEKIPEGAQPYADENGKIEKFHDHIENVDSVKYYIKDHVIYDAEPWTLKLWVNAAKIRYGNTESYILSFSSGDCHTKQARESSCDPENTNPITFTNKYEKPQEFSIILGGKKTINNGDIETIPNGRFTFTLQQYNKDTNGWDPVSDEFTVQNNGENFTFPEIQLNEEDADYTETRDQQHFFFYYKIKESKDCSPYTADEAVYIASVHLQKKGKWAQIAPDSPKYFKFANEEAADAGFPKDIFSNATNTSLKFNNTYNSTGETIFYVNKELIGRAADPTKDEFTFTLTCDNPSRENDNQEITIHGDGDGYFGTLNYTLDDVGKTYTYTIKEKEGDDSTISYSNQEYNISVTIADNKEVYAADENGHKAGDPKLTITRSPENIATAANPAKFTNIYDATGNIKISANKSYGAGIKTDRSFEFELSGDGYTTQKKSITGRGSVYFYDENDPNSVTVEYKLSDLPKNNDGSYGKRYYKYVLKEVVPQDAESVTINGKTYKKKDNVIYDSHEYHILVVLSYDAATKTLKKDVYGRVNEDPEESGDYSINSVISETFTNDYTPNSTKTPISGTKEFTGTLTAGMFTFNLAAADDDNNFTQAAIDAGNVVMPKTSVTNGEAPATSVNDFVFGDIEFKSAGTYKFTVTEDTTNKIENVVYSEDIYNIQVTVSYDDNGDLTIKDGDRKITKVGTVGSLPSIGFTNKKTNPGQIPLVAHKDLTGRALEADQFTFVLKNAADINNDEVAALQTKKNDKDGNVNFEDLKYEFKDLGDAETKVFNYAIKEVLPTGEGVEDAYDESGNKIGVNYQGYTYDGHIEYVNVTVSKEKVDGKLTGNLIVKADNAVTSQFSNYNNGEAKIPVFSNKYNAEGKAKISGIKRLIGRRFTEKDNGKLSVQLIDDKTGKVIQTKDIVYNGALRSVLTGIEAEFNFDWIEYTEAGTYTYTVKEIGSLPKVTNDAVGSTDGYKVTVTMTDDGKGHLTEAVSPSKMELCFVNNYSADNEITFSALKKVNGEVNALVQNKFEFTLAGIGNDTGDTKKNGGDGVIEFRPIRFTQDDVVEDTAENREAGLVKTLNDGRVVTVKKYKITENAIADPHFTKTLRNNKEVEYTAEAYIWIKDDGTLGVDKAYFNENGDQVPEASVEFDNTYVTDGKVKLFAQKKLTGRALDAGKFTFSLYEEDGITPVMINNVPVKASNVAAASGEIGIAEFPEITYDVSDLNKTNSHEVEITDSKRVYAKHYVMKEDHDGAVLQSDGSYKDSEGYTYDGKAYNVVVTLTDDGSGSIVTKWYAYSTGSTPDKITVWDRIVEFVTGKNANQNAEFDNYYAAEGAIEITALKKLAGKLFSAGDFSFTLSGENENGEQIVQTKQNDANGNVVFDRISYTKPTEEGKPYVYTIKEVVPQVDEEGFDAKRIHYDTTEYTLTVTVTDPGTGKLQVNTAISSDPERDDIPTVTYETDADNTAKTKKIDLCKAGPLVFENTYQPKPVTITLGGNKVLTGRDIESGEFSFEAKNASGNSKEYSDTAENEGNTFTFNKPITFSIDDFAKDKNGVYASSAEFAYEITEVIPEDATYDEVRNVYVKDDVIYPADNKITIIVTVTNDGSGVLGVSYKVGENTFTDPSKGVTFINEYDAKNATIFSVQKKLVKDGTDDEEYIPKEPKAFQFKLTGTDLNTPLTATAYSDGKPVDFAQIDYKLSDLGAQNGDGTYGPKTYKYTVSEVKESLDGYTYSKEIYNAEVVVSSDGKSPELKVERTVTYKDEDGNDNTYDEKKPLVFKNKYKATGDLDIEGEKTLVSDEDLQPEQFEFILSEGSKSEETGKITYSPIDSAKNGADGSFKFTRKYTTKDIGKTFYYQVNENIPANYTEKGIDYDDTVYSIEVKVVDNYDGTLGFIKKVNDETKDKIVVPFVNKKITPDSTSFEATKSLEGKALEENMFSFVLEGDDIEAQTKQNKSNTDGNPNVFFDPIKYELKQLKKNDDGTYSRTFHYTIKELGRSELGKTEDDGIEYNYEKKLYDVYVDVKVENGKMTASEPVYKDNGTIVSGAVFKNRYESSDKVVIGGHKILDGFVDDVTPIEEYKFELLDENGNTVWINKDGRISAANAADATEQVVAVTPKNAKDIPEYKFADIVFNQDDLLDAAHPDHKFRFKVKEQIPATKAPNVTYAYLINEYNVTVALSYDINGKLVATATDDRNVGVTNLDFTNVYKADGTVKFGGEKEVTGKNTVNNAYEFNLFDLGKDGKENPTEPIESVNNNGASFTFKEIKYDQSDIGTHYYKITESASTEDGSVFDQSEYIIKVNIKPGENGKLDTDDQEITWIKKDKDGKEIDRSVLGPEDVIKFTNTYAAYGEHPIKVKKIMHNRPLLQDEFTFILRDEKGNVVEEKNNKAAMYSRENLMAEDEIYFEALKFTQEDLKGPDGKSYLPEIQKYYTVEELHGNKKGYTYDSTVYVVELTIKPTKNLIKEGQYEGDEHVGDYDLEVTEKIVKKNGGTAENTSGGLFASLFKGLIGNSDNAATEIIFENTYEASCVVDPPIFTKQIMGRNIQRGEFEFSIDSKDGLPSMKEFEKSVSKRMVYVPDENGELVKSESDKGYHRVVKNGYTVTGDQTTNPGEISVDDLKFWNTDLWAFDDAEGDLETGVISKKFVYTAIEVSDVKVEGVIPSPAVFVLEFTVTDDGSGELKVSPKPEWKQITPNFLTDEQYSDTFLNLYNMEGSVEIRGIKKMDGRELTDDDVFKFTITDDQTGETATVENNWANGHPNEIVFNKDNAPFLKYRDGSFDDDGDGLYNDEIHQAGDYTYTIKEELSNKNGVEYDQTSYKVYVSVNKVTSPKAEGWLDAKVTHVEHILSDNNKTRFAIADGNHFEFDNKFKATGELKIDGTKLLVDENGNDIGSTQSLEGQYEFALYNYDSEALRARANTKGLLVDVTRTAANGDFSLTVPNGYTEQDLREKNGDYATEKTLYYKIVETKPSNGTMVGTLFESDGVIYDNTEYFVDVTLKNNGTDKLEVTKTITNATTGEQVTDVSYTNIYKNFVSIDGQKYWVDKETDPSKRPDVILNLYSSAVDNGRTIINTYTLKAPELRYRFTTDAAGKKLPATDSSGRTITYRVEELPIRGYLSEQKGYDFYNTSGDILIRKIDAETGTALSGATLAIYDGTTEIERWVSGESAHVVEKELTKGKTYTLREISAPEGYGVAADQTFTVPTDGSDITVTMADPPIIGSVRLIKRDETTRESLAGAEFALYTSAGTRIYATGTAGSYRATNLTSNGVFVTDATGSLTITDLPYGTYYFVETMAPDGYALSSEHLGFTILRSGELVEVTFLDPKALGSVRLRKANEDGSRTLAGAVFELYSATPRTVGQAATATIFTDAYFRYGTYRTNSAGEIYVGDLPWDDYFFVEVDAPTGYEVNRDVNGDDLVYTFSIDRFTANRVIDVGYVYNRPTTPPPPPTTPTPPPTTTTTTPPPTTVTTTPPPTTTTTPSGVLGERVERIEKGGVVNGVLGVRAKPTSGVLGVRSGPVTGDASNIILWLLLLCACVATIVATIVTGKKKKTGANK